VISVESDTTIPPTISTELSEIVRDGMQGPVRLRLETNLVTELVP
jgi:hypothetical protein